MQKVEESAHDPRENHGLGSVWPYRATVDDERDDMKLGAA